MRLDKYLKVVRIIKRRTISKDIISFGQVLLNGKVAKPASTIKVDDLITLTIGTRIITIKVKEINDKINKQQAVEMYEVIKEEKVSI